MIASQSKKKFSDKILEWYKHHGRYDLPWQKNKDPYLVWISEIMLQQTQVGTVIPFYIKFIDRFKTIGDLAEASEDEVMAYWSGLGFYSRARNLHKTAKIIAVQFSCRFPDSYENLIQLPGIGRSTAGAILSFCYKKKFAILDGNVKRVLSRFFGIQESINLTKTEKHLWDISEQLLPDNDIDIYTQAIMDFGATLCTPKKPQCDSCPINQTCIAKKNNLTGTIPIKNKTKTQADRSTEFYIYECNKQILLVKNRTGVWNGLWLPPQQNSLSKKYIIHKQGERQCVFSHYRLKYKYFLIKITNKKDLMVDGLWFDWKEISDLGLPAPIKSLMINLSN